MRRIILSMNAPAPYRILQPGSFIDLGHVDILLWDPPRLPGSFGFFVSPTTAPRVLLSAFLSQSARLVRGRGMIERETYWQSWPLAHGPFEAVSRHLENVAAGCANGTVRYNALRYNCFHLAVECLQVAGVAPRRVPRQWFLFLRTLGFNAFRRTVMAGCRHSAMARELTARANGG